jgi:ribonuclease E
MTAEIHSDAHGATDPFDPYLPSSQFPHDDPLEPADSASDAPASDEHVDAGFAPRDFGSPEDPLGEASLEDELPEPIADVSGEPADGDSAEAAARKRRRRGSRGGRRRRGRREGATDEEGAAGTTLAAVDPPLPGEDDGFESGDPVETDGVRAESAASGEPLPAGAAGPSAERPRRSRRGRGGRGRSAAAGGNDSTREDAEGGPAISPAARTTSSRAPSSRPAGDAAEPARAPGGRGGPRRTKSSRSGDSARTARGPASDRAAFERPRSPEPAGARTPRGSVPREIDAFDDDEDLILDAVPAVEVDGVAEERNALESGADGKKGSRRGSRGGRRRKKHGTTGPSARAPAPTPVEIEAIPGEDDDLPMFEREEVARTEVSRSGESHADHAPAARSGRRRRGRGRTRDAAAEDAASDPDAPRIVPEAERRSLILVNATDPEEQRVAVLEDGKITDFLMTVKDQDTLVNDIYRGRVVNLEPAIGAAFIDFGQGRNGFLHTSDVLSAYGDKDFDLDKLLSTQIDPEEWDENSSAPAVAADIDDADDDEDEGSRGRKGGKDKGAKGGRGKRRFEARPRLPITGLLKKGQTVVVQVTKDAIGDKGPTLTTYISIPGRYLVLMPSMSRTGVSRKIEDEKERRRLKRILQALEVPKGMGVIVRTAGVGHSKSEIKRDLDYLVSLWTAFGKKLHQGHGPAALYRESDVAIKTMRDLFSTNTKAVIVDDPEVQRQIIEFTEKLMPEDVGRVELHDGPKTLFQAHNVEPDFERIFQRRIELPSGGSIVFDQAEALVAIDVNSGRTRSDGFDFEDIALKTNLEAAPEIARQMRLRDLGGIIVVDFIDMMKMSNIRAVEKAFKEALEPDRARSKIGRISQFGLLEMTRQRLGPGMDKKVFHHCPRCRGTGRIRTVNSRAAAILRRLSSAMTHKGFQTVEVRAHPEVVAYLKNECSDHLRALEYRLQKEVRLIEVADQAEDSVLRYLRPDGREVRPGGRRKR